MAARAKGVRLERAAVEGEEVRFAHDSLLEGDGFERSVPRHGKHCCRGLTYASRAKSRKQRYRRSARGELVSAAGPTPPIKAVSSQV